MSVFKLNRNLILHLLTMGSQSQFTPRCPQDMFAIFSFLSSPMWTHAFVKGDLWITEAALWEEPRLKGLFSLALL